MSFVDTMSFAVMAKDSLRESELALCRVLELCLPWVRSLINF